jgi:hypothetical protein
VSRELIIIGQKVKSNKKMKNQSKKNEKSPVNYNKESKASVYERNFIL